MLAVTFSGETGENINNILIYDINGKPIETKHNDFIRKLKKHKKHNYNFINGLLDPTTLENLDIYELRGM